MPEPTAAELIVAADLIFDAWIAGVLLKRAIARRAFSRMHAAVLAEALGRIPPLPDLAEAVQVLRATCGPLWMGEQADRALEVLHIRQAEMRAQTGVAAQEDDED